MNVFAAATTALTALGSLVGVRCSAPEPVRPTIETLAFCGANPYDRYAAHQVHSMVVYAGIDAFFGPCLPAGDDYSSAYPGQRYMARNDYLKLTVLDANEGAKTVPYDAGLWSDDPATRQQAIEFWRPHLKWIAAWDMGDEPTPGTDYWFEFQRRWEVMQAFVVPATGIEPILNHVGQAASLEGQLAWGKGDASLTFGLYPADGGVALAAAFDSRTTMLTCDVNALHHESGGYQLYPTAASITDTMSRLRAAGCDRFIIFGGDVPEGTNIYGTSSLVTSTGAPTAWAASVLKGAR